MKTKIIFFKSIILIIYVTLLFSCSGDDNSSIETSLQDMVINLDENPNSGDLITTIQISHTDTVSYSITSQSIADALKIDPISGQLTVFNSLLFDFETNPVITADINATTATDTEQATITIRLNNLDDLASFLSTSKQDYNNANNGDWIAITKDEYINLEIRINDVKKVATSDVIYNKTPTSSVNNEFTTSNHLNLTNRSSIPTGSFVFAVKFNIQEIGGSFIKMKQSSTSGSSGYEDFGHLITSNSIHLGDNYYVLKGSNLPTTDTGFLAIHINGFGLSKVISTDLFHRIKVGDAYDDINIMQTGNFLYQGLSSTQKQWN